MALKEWVFSSPQDYKTQFGTQSISKVRLCDFHCDLVQPKLNAWIKLVWTDSSSSEMELRLQDPFTIEDLDTADGKKFNGVVYIRQASYYHTDLKQAGITESNILTKMKEMGYLSAGTLV